MAKLKVDQVENSRLKTFAMSAYCARRVHELFAYWSVSHCLQLPVRLVYRHIVAGWGGGCNISGDGPRGRLGHKRLLLGDSGRHLLCLLLLRIVNDGFGLRVCRFMWCDGEYIPLCVVSRTPTDTFPALEMPPFRLRWSHLGTALPNLHRSRAVYAAIKSLGSGP